MSMRRFLLCVLAIAGIGLITWGHRPPHVQSGEEIILLPKPGTAKLASFGHHQAVAAVYWMKSIVYFGGHFLSGQSPVQMVRLMDIVTSLDSLFLPAYSLTGGALESADSTDVKILERGIQVFPNEWRLRLFLAMKLGEKYHNYAGASMVLRPLANNPDPKMPSYLRTMYQSMNTEGLPLRPYIIESMNSYFTQGELFQISIERRLARRIFHPNLSYWQVADSNEILKVHQILIQIKDDRLDPVQGIEQLMSFAPPSDPSAHK